jgi:hypothetical protein
LDPDQTPGPGPGPSDGPDDDCRRRKAEGGITGGGQLEGGGGIGQPGCRDSARGGEGGSIFGLLAPPIEWCFNNLSRIQT